MCESRENLNKIIQTAQDEADRLNEINMQKNEVIKKCIKLLSIDGCNTKEKVKTMLEGIVDD